MRRLSHTRMALIGCATVAALLWATPGLLAQAASTQSDLRINVAMDRLYAVLMERPGTADAMAARLPLARLLALAGELSSAILQCQLLHDRLAADSPVRQEAVATATLLARRLRAASSSDNPYFSTIDRVPAPTRPEPGPARPIQLSGTWDGKTRQLKRVRSIAALSSGDLLVIDRDYDGLLRCQLPASTCAPVGPAGRQQLVRVGAADWCYVLDERGQVVRALDSEQRQITTFGPTIGTAKLGRVEDIAVDSAYGLYMLDRDLNRISVVTMRAMPDGPIKGLLYGSFQIPREAMRGLADPWTLTVASDGSLVIAAKGSPNAVRLR